ncbi:uncharacterized protein F4822DRAFT_442751 [Hypoxylon trugodes]|uniref:uncharacterized protein n=1 Tax=Hypoxylon trugodes TaxID=326681 RepID=UPI0021926C7A|nr:uncharacterized protein F4822DRAFT_442751 [Hypoxylon trugodes]KAI1389449.1 hypothetical protein F4822DRAFT_442751 [Hypoxylon trugodes]
MSSPAMDNRSPEEKKAALRKLLMVDYRYGERFPRDGDKEIVEWLDHVDESLEIFRLADGARFAKYNPPIPVEYPPEHNYEFIPDIRDNVRDLTPFGPDETQRAYREGDMIRAGMQARERYGVWRIMKLKKHIQKFWDPIESQVQKKFEEKLGVEVKLFYLDPARSLPSHMIKHRNRLFSPIIDVVLPMDYGNLGNMVRSKNLSGAGLVMGEVMEKFMSTLKELEDENDLPMPKKDGKYLPWSSILAPIFCINEGIAQEKPLIWSCRSRFAFMGIGSSESSNLGLVMLHDRSMPNEADGIAVWYEPDFIDPPYM